MHRFPVASGEPGLPKEPKQSSVPNHWSEPTYRKSTIAERAMTRKQHGRRASQRTRKARTRSEPRTLTSSVDERANYLEKQRKRASQVGRQSKPYERAIKREKHDVRASQPQGEPHPRGASQKERRACGASEPYETKSMEAERAIDREKQACRASQVRGTARRRSEPAEEEKQNERASHRG